ncbi:PLP-dependent aminotransferase family protein [Paeniglutamicibacter sp. MACA_103]|uniref:MocR-like pyridoxine biosynthesis transcription factor PdxR n=1 Tax=Paeniglutamicibacter sp. MACA_103 TaxID=3377337 RepID=UPI003894FC6A
MGVLAIIARGGGHCVDPLQELSALTGEPRAARMALLPAPPGTPLATRVRRTVTQLIVRGIWPTGAKVPSSRKFAYDLGVSRTTVQSAYHALIDEGYLVPSDRRGVFVSERLPAVAQILEPEPAAGDDERWEESVQWDRWASSGRESAWPELQRERQWNRFDFPFVTGQHDPVFFPDGPWLRALKKALSDEHRYASLDDRLEDDPLLLQSLCARVLTVRGLRVSPENILVTMGSQQGLQLLAETTLRWGDRVAMENPGYIDARHVFHRVGAQMIYVPVDAQGAIPQQEYNGARLLFVTPSHQHPTNVTLSLERRLQLIAQAEEQDFLIVEDDYDAELQYSGQTSPCMASLDPNGRTIYLGTLSKVLAPGLRMGYVVGPKKLIAALRQRRRYAHRQPPGHIQRALALLMDAGDLARSYRRYRNDLRLRWHAATNAARELFPPGQILPPGGTGLWLRTGVARPSNAIANEARAHGILIDSGNHYFSHPEDGRGFIRVGFGVIKAERIPEGMRRLAALLPGEKDAALE